MRISPCEPREKENVLKYTFINELDQQKTVDIPDEYIKINCRNLGISTKEAVYMYLSDEGYIKNDVVENLTSKAKINGVNSSKAKSNGSRKKSNRKPDVVKRQLIAALAEFIQQQDGVVDCEIANVERIVAFGFADERYELVLQKKRKPKNE